MKTWLVSYLAVFGFATGGLYGQTPNPEGEASPNTRTKWKLSHRLQGGWEYDSNIFESSSRRAASGSARFILNTRGERRSPRWQMQYHYSTALQAYNGYRNENKLSHEAAAALGARLQPWLQLTAQANGTLKFYLENAADYGTTSGNTTASFFLPARFAAEVSGETGQLDYAETDLYDFTFTGVELTLRRPIVATGAVAISLNRRTLHYERQKLYYDALSGLIVGPDKQRDALTTLRVAVTYGRKVVAQCAVEAQRNRSNSFGYDFNRLRVSGLLGFRPHAGWMLRAAGLLQSKTYRDDLAQLNLRDLDTEREQSNFFVVDLSRDLSAEIAVMARAAIYDNESTVPGVFYRKILYFAGLEVRL